MTPEDYNIIVTKETIEGTVYHVARIQELPDVTEYGGTYQEAKDLALDTLATSITMFNGQGMDFPKPKLTVSFRAECIDDVRGIEEHLTCLDLTYVISINKDTEYPDVDVELTIEDYTLNKLWDEFLLIQEKSEIHVVLDTLRPFKLKDNGLTRRYSTTNELPLVW